MTFQPPRTTRLLAFARELQRAATFEELLVITRTELEAAVGYKHAWLFVAPDPDIAEWRLLDAAGAVRADAWKLAPVLEIRGDAMLEEIARSEGPVVVDDARTDPRTNKQIVEQLGNRTIINVPLRLLDQTLGAFGTGTFRDEGCRPPTAEQLDYLVSMGSQLAVAAGRIRFLAEQRRVEEDLRITLDSIGDGVIATDAANRITRMNPVAEQLTGWPLAEARGMDLADVFRLVDEETPDAMLVARDGTERAIGHNVSPIRGEDGALRGTVVVFRDRTEQRRVERTLKRSELRFRRLLDSGIIGVVLSDTKGTIYDANDAFLSIVGYTRDDLFDGKVSGATLNTPEREETDAQARRQLAEQGFAHPWEKDLVRKDGTRVPVLIGVAMVDEPVGESVAFVVDLSERKHAEAMRRAKEAAEAANAELEAFSYSVAHDLRTPLRAINGFSIALAEDYAAKLDATAKEYLDRIVAATDRMGKLIDALLGLARLARTAPKRESVDLTHLASGVVTQLRTSDPERVVMVDIAEGLTTTGDPQLLRALLENLLGNAWKFTSTRTAAHIEFGREGATYYVRDDGVGFNMAHASKLFAPFRRLHTHEEFEGTGIGLATAERIIRRHGGRIWAEGAEGRGATFRFTLSSDEVAS